MSKPQLTRQGVVLQSAAPRKSQTMHRARGLLVRGVVVRVYGVDQDAMAPGTASIEGNGEARIGSSEITSDAGPPAIYCDVLTYSNLAGAREKPLRRVLVPNGRGGLHDGRVWIPRPATINMKSGRQFVLGPDGDADKRVDPSDLDGDHVLVGFMDDDLNFPVILNGIPHPRADYNRDAEYSGRRLKPRAKEDLTHGGSDLRRYHGGFYGMTGNGDFVIDVSEAHRGRYQKDGSEPDPPKDSRSGNVDITLQQNGQFTVNGLAAALTLTDFLDGATTLGRAEIGGAGENGNSARLQFNAGDPVSLSFWHAENGEFTRISFSDAGDMTIDVGTNPVDEDTHTKLLTIQAGEIFEIVQGNKTITATGNMTIAADGDVYLGTDSLDKQEPVPLGNSLKEANDDYTVALATAVSALINVLQPAVLALNTSVIEPAVQSGSLSNPVKLSDIKPIVDVLVTTTTNSDDALLKIKSDFAEASNDHADSDYLSDKVWNSD